MRQFESHVTSLSLPIGANVFLRLVDLLVKVGELVDKLFDEDEELMKSWVSLSSESDPNEDAQQDVVSSLLEAATQLRSVIRSCDRLSVYLLPIPMSAGGLTDKRSYWIRSMLSVKSVCSGQRVQRGLKYISIHSSFLLL